MVSVIAGIDLSTYCKSIASRAKDASRVLVGISTECKNRWLRESAERLQQNIAPILRENQVDIAEADSYGLSEAEKDRLRLTDDRILQIARGLRAVADLPDPVGEVIEQTTRPNGLDVRKVRVPLGVIFFVYEARPNVTADAAAIAIKSGNAIVLRGGKEAFHSSMAIIRLLKDAADETGIPADAIQFVETLDRNAVGELLALPEYIDLAIPRGGEGLIRRVTSEARMPVLKHYDGNCHVYVDQYADLEKALSIVENAKCQRMGVCNAMESLVVHAEIAESFLPQLARRLASYKMEFRADSEAARLLPNSIAATEDDWSREYLGPIMSIRIVDTIGDAIQHINRYSSGHTESIVTENNVAADQFVLEVDSSAVIVNASTRFNDGGELGMGAEIGISTDKFHARGPCGVRELTTYKYVVVGNGQVRT